MSKLPPRATPAGKVVARLNVAPLPIANEGGLTTHAPDGGAAGVCAGGTAGSTAGESSALTSQPSSESAPDANPKHKTVRRPTSFINSTFNNETSRATSAGVGTPAPRFFCTGFNDGKLHRSIPAFDLMHYVIRTGLQGSACTGKESHGQPIRFDRARQIVRLESRNRASHFAHRAERYLETTPAAAEAMSGRHAPSPPRVAGWRSSSDSE